VTVLFDFTVQHTGWFHGTFADGGFEDFFDPLATGLQARSWWCSTLNGQPIDQAVGFTTGTAASSQYWFNQHRNGTQQGLTIPSPFLVTAATRINTYTRVPAANLSTLYRVVVTDQGSTGPPSDPP
jgi:hypothetical protein